MNKTIMVHLFTLNSGYCLEEKNQLRILLFGKQNPPSLCFSASLYSPHVSVIHSTIMLLLSLYRCEDVILVKNIKDKQIQLNLVLFLDWIDP